MLNPVLLFAQVLLLLRSCTQQADNGITPAEHAAWCLDVRKFHEIYGSTEGAIVAEGAWTAKALASSTSTKGAVFSSQDALCRQWAWQHGRDKNAKPCFAVWTGAAASLVYTTDR
ncbi:hypothetical protein MRX96_003470 [Rhipicephalus microplus]